MKARIVVYTSDGSEYNSNWDDWAEDVFEQFSEAMKVLKEVNHLQINRGKAVINFNMAHVIAAGLEKGE